MRYLVDTNVISELRKGNSCNRNVERWHREIDETDIFVSVLVFGEIRKGAEKIRHRDPERAGVLEDWIVALYAALGDRVLPLTAEIAEEWGRMSAMRTVPIVDCLLAATAKVHELTIASRNTADFAGLDVPVFDPFA